MYNVISICGYVYMHHLRHISGRLMHHENLRFFELARQQELADPLALLEQFLLLEVSKLADTQLFHLLAQKEPLSC